MSTDYPEKIDLGATVLIIELKQIVDADKTQIREQENGKVIDDLVMQYQMEEQAQNIKTDAYPKNFPPIVVVRTPSDSNKYWIIDGHHRYAAAVACRYKKIVASVIDNSIFQVKTLDDLHFLQGRENIAVTANRTPETKRRQVLAVLKKRPYWTKNQIAQFCRVSFYLVESVFGEMESAGKKVATRKPAEKAAEAIANPKNDKKSNRQIAKETGVGEATVRRLRQNSNLKNDAPDITPEVEEYLSKKGWTEQQKKDFVEGVHAYHEFAKKNAMPKTSDWADEKLDGYMYEEDRLRQLRLADKDADALDKVSQKAQEFIDNNAPAEPAKQPYEKPEVLDAPPASADDKAEPAETSSHVTKSGSIPLRNPDNILMVVEDVINWLGSGRIEYFATIFNDKISNPQ